MAAESSLERSFAGDNNNGSESAAMCVSHLVILFESADWLYKLEVEWVLLNVLELRVVAGVHVACVRLRYVNRLAAH